MSIKVCLLYLNCDIKSPSTKSSLLFYMHDHAPVTLNLARLPPNQFSPDRPRHGAHSIALNRDLDVSSLISDPVYGADNRSRAYSRPIECEVSVMIPGEREREKKITRAKHFYEAARLHCLGDLRHVHPALRDDQFRR